MTKFFESDVVQNELREMQELYIDINRMGLVLSVEAKIEQLTKLLRLIEIQQTMFMRVTLSDQEDAQQLLSQVREAATMIGMNAEDVNPQFYEALKSDVHKMIDELERSK